METWIILLNNATFIQLMGRNVYLFYVHGLEVETILTDLLYCRYDGLASRWYSGQISSIQSHYKPLVTEVNCSRESWTSCRATESANQYSCYDSENVFLVCRGD